MAKRILKTKSQQYHLPVVVERDEDGYYVAVCPRFHGCYTQGETLDEALENIEEVIELVLEDEVNRQDLEEYHPETVGFHHIAVQLNA